MREFPSPHDDKTLIDIRATISAELTGAEVCNGQRTRGGGKSIDSTKVYRINSTAHLINNDFRRERSVYKRGHARASTAGARQRIELEESFAKRNGDSIRGRLWQSNRLLKTAWRYVVSRPDRITNDRVRGRFELAHAEV